MTREGRERLAQALAIVFVAGLSLALREDDFALFLVARVLIVVIACLGLNVQFGYAGLVNFAGATFFGVGGYMAAVLSRSPSCAPAGTTPLSSPSPSRSSSAPSSR